MRAGDRPLPAIDLHPLDPLSPLAAWPFRPVIAVRNRANVWVDVTCDWRGMSIENGPVDQYGNVNTSTVVLELDNAGAKYARWNADGTLVNYGAGTMVAIWVDDGAEQSWLFYGTAASWSQVGAGATVRVVAYDRADELARALPAPYTPGVAGQFPGPRLTALMASANISGLPTAFDQGSVHLTAQTTDRVPLDEARAVAASDGGVFFVDVDGTARYLSRGWWGGRIDQETAPTLSDNVCGEAGIYTVWDCELTSADDQLADYVGFANEAGTLASIGDPTGRYVLTNQEPHQWTDAAEGLALVNFTYATRTPARLVPRAFTLYLFDPLQPGLAPLGVALRLFDGLRFVHDQPSDVDPPRVSIPAVVVAVRHDVTPAGTWVVGVQALRGLPTLRPLDYDHIPTPYDYDHIPDPWAYGF